MKENSYNLFEQCSLLQLCDEVVNNAIPINCGDEDLDDFFQNNAELYSNELLGKTYAWVTDEHPRKIVAEFTVANDSIKSKLLSKSVRNKIQRPIDNQKRGRSYPAVLLGRIGVDVEYQGGGRHIGTQVIDYLKFWFRSTDNKTGCRFLVVDAYNKPHTLSFYESCGFKYLYASEQDEKLFYELEESQELRTRMMYFDLKS